MVTPELLDFIKQCRANGQSDEFIKISILNQNAGWTENDIWEAFAKLNSIQAGSQNNIPTPPPPAPVYNAQNTYTSNIMNSSPKKSHVGMVVFICILIILLGGGIYAWQAGFIENAITTFKISSEPIPRDKFLANIIQNIAMIKTVNFKVTIEGHVNDRDPDAVPYVYDGATLEKKREAYTRDYQRIDDLQKILMAIKYSEKSGLPGNLSDLGKVQKFYKINTKDPSGIDYIYTKNDAKSFSLSATLETDEAINQLKKYNDRQTTMPDSMKFEKININGRKVTLTEKSDNYFFVSRSVPEPVIVSILKSMKSVPASSDMAMELGVKVDSKYKGDIN